MCPQAHARESSGRSGSIRLDFARGPWVCESSRFLEPRLSRFLPVPRPAPGPVALGLPLGIWQTLAQPARQHLRLSAHFPSELHSCVQFRSSFSLGHTPAFSSTVSGRRGRGQTVGTEAPAPEDARLLLPGPWISSFKEFSVSGPRQTPPSLETSADPTSRPGVPNTWEYKSYLTLGLRARYP